MFQCSSYINYLQKLIILIILLLLCRRKRIDLCMLILSIFKFKFYFSFIYFQKNVESHKIKDWLCLIVSSFNCPNTIIYPFNIVFVARLTKRYIVFKLDSNLYSSTNVFPGKVYLLSSVSNVTWFPALHYYRVRPAKNTIQIIWNLFWRILFL